MKHVENNNIFPLFGNSPVAPDAANVTVFPPLPNFPPSGCPDPTTDPNWPEPDSNGNYDPSNFNDTGYMQALNNDLTYISAHPSDPMGYIVLAKIVQRLSGLHNANGTSLLSIVESQISPSVLEPLLADGIDYASEFGFLYGYDGGQGGTALDYMGFAQALEASLVAGQSDPLIKSMIDECQNIQNNANTFVSDHIYNGTPPGAVDAFGNPLQVGDIYYAFQVPGTSTLVYYDWSAAIKAENGPNTPQWATTTLQFIVNMIENTDPVSGNPNPDVNSLNQILNQLHISSSINTFEEILKETGDVGMAILAFMYEWEGYNMNTSLSGPADVMDQEKRFSQLAQQIEDDLKEIGPNMTPAQAQQIAANTLVLFQEIQGSGQFAQGLGPAVQSAMETFQNTSITYTPPNSSTPVTQTVWQLFSGAASGSISGAQLAAALQQGLAPTPPTPNGQNPPTGPSDPGSTALQGVLGGFDGLITAVSSNSTAEVTSSQQGQALIQAMDKVMTGVTDKSQGINTGVIASTIKNQISS